MMVGVPRETSRERAGFRSLRPSLLPSREPASRSSGNRRRRRVRIRRPRFRRQGSTIAATRGQLFASSDVILQVRTAATNPHAGDEDLKLYRPGQTVIGTCDPLVAHAAVQSIAERGVSLFSLELMPRITRAQSMDILSSMATIAGYKAVLLAADALPKMFPMMMTAAGDHRAGQGLHHRSRGCRAAGDRDARRLGAIVHAYDVRPAVKEQVESLGGKFVQLDLETDSAEGGGGYAKALGDDFYRKQREMMSRVVAESDVVITTAAVPGKKAPILVTARDGRRHAPRFGRRRPRGGAGRQLRADPTGETVIHRGVTVLGPLNLPAMVPITQASSTQRTSPPSCSTS